MKRHRVIYTYKLLGVIKNNYSALLYVYYLLVAVISFIGNLTPTLQKKKKEKKHACGVTISGSSTVAQILVIPTCCLCRVGKRLMCLMNDNNIIVVASISKQHDTYLDYSDRRRKFLRNKSIFLLSRLLTCIAM